MRVSLEKKIKLLENRLAELKKLRSRNVLIAKSDSDLWLCKPKDSNECYSLCVYDNDTDLEDIENGRVDEKAFMNFEAKEEMEDLIENLQRELENWEE